MLPQPKSFGVHVRFVMHTAALLCERVMHTCTGKKRSDLTLADSLHFEYRFISLLCDQWPEIILHAVEPIVFVLSFSIKCFDISIQGNCMNCCDL